MIFALLRKREGGNVMKKLSKWTMLLLVVVVVSSSASASDIKGVTYEGGGVQIWLDVDEFDYATPQFVDRRVPGNLSGASYQFRTPYSNSDDVQEWYAEYTLDPADLPGISLSGTWYFWARGYMTLGSTGGIWEESDYLFVKGDDAVGPTWGADALAAADNADDRILNEWSNNPDGPGLNVWGWGSNAQWDTGLDVKSKEFNLVDGVITFRINERETATSNVHIDVICWSNVDENAYMPTDADYQAAGPPQPAVPGDTDGDGDVDLDDLFAVRNNFGTSSGATRADGDVAPHPAGDGAVNLDDLFTVRNNFGTGLTVPEPATLSLMGLAAVALLRRRSR